MKVGRISLLTAFLLALPVMAFAGGDPCQHLGGDADADGICDSVDNCPPQPPPHLPSDTANPAQADLDGDGRGDVCDNCLTLANGPLVYAVGTFGPLAAVSQCDRDSDGFGNACDGDFAGFTFVPPPDGFVTPADNPSYTTALGGFFPPGNGAHDMNCDGFMTPADNEWYVGQLGGFFAGPSGWVCAASALGGHLVGPPGVCPPAP